MKEIFERKNNIAVIAGNPQKAVMFLFWPLLLSFMVIAVNTYLDAFWVAGLGTDATSAVNAMSDIYGCIGAVGAGMGVACAAAISFYLGDGNRKKAESLACHSIIVCLILSVLLGTLMFVLVDPFIDVLELQDIKGLCYDYVMPLIWCNIALLVNGALCGILRAEGANLRTVIASFLTMASVVFNPLFIVEFDMGVSGAAWGTIASTFLSTAYLVFVFVTKRNSIPVSFRGFRFDADALKELLFISIPYGIQNSLRKLAGLVDKAIIVLIVGSTMGTAAIAVFALPWTYVRVVECLGLAFGAALIPVLGFNLGKRNYKKGDAAIKFTYIAAVVSSSAFAVIILVMAGPLIDILTMDESFAGDREIMVGILIILAFVCPLYTVRDISFNILQTLRKNNLCVVITFAMIALKLILMYIGGTLFGPLYMVTGNVLGQYIGGMAAFAFASYYWKRVDVEKINVPENIAKRMDELENMKSSKKT